MAGDFDLHHLLAGPVIAMNDAQADAAASFYDLFERFAFEPADRAARGAGDAPRRLRMISFLAERATPEGIERRRISMPLLQMIPIGGVAIDSAKIEFALSVTAGPLALAKPAAGQADIASAERKLALKGRIAPTGGGSDATGNLRVEIVLKQVDLPAGYLDMIAETQGGMSQLVPVPDPRRPLFEASFPLGSPPRIAKAGKYRLDLEILLLPPAADGIELTLQGDPRGAYRILEPPGPVHVLRERSSVPVVIEASREWAKLVQGDRDILMTLSGRAIGADETEGDQTVQLVLLEGETS